LTIRRSEERTAAEDLEDTPGTDPGANPDTVGKVAEGASKDQRARYARVRGCFTDTTRRHAHELEDRDNLMRAASKDETTCTERL